MPLKRNHEKIKHKPMPYIKPPVSSLNKVLFLGIVAFIFAALSFVFLGATVVFWILIVIGVILAPNALFLRFDFAQPFLLRYFITMIKTKRFVKIIIDISHHAKWFEKICLIGLFIGFGLVGIDYWKARKVGGWKRILILIISALILGVFFYYTCSILFSIPALAPLFIPCLIGFVILGFGGMSLAMLIGYGVLAVQGLFIAKQLCPSIAPVLPGVPIPGLGVPIPLIAWVSLAMVLIIHECSHGIMMAYYKEKIKSVGLLMAGIFPLGAFVEQDDKTFNKLEDKKALMVLSAGSSSNLFTLILSVLFIIIFSFALTPFTPTFEKEFNKTYDGVKINSVEEKVSFCGIDGNAPAKGKLFSGDIVKQVNGIDVNSISGVNKEFVKSEEDMNFLVQRINIDTNKLYDVNVSLTPFKFVDLNIKKIGAEFGAIPTGYQPPIWIVVAQTLITLIAQILLFFAVISFAAGSFNFFPADPFDGGRMAKIMLAPYFAFLGFNKKETHKFIGRLFIWLLIISLTLNMIPYLTMIP